MKTTCRFLHFGVCTAIFVALLGGAASIAIAVPTLYHGPGGVSADPSTVPFVPIGSTETIHLFFNPGTNPSSNSPFDYCNGGAGGTGGDGDETCGVHFKIKVTGDLLISNFQPSWGLSESHINASNTELSASLVTTNPVLPLGPTEIATFDLDVSGSQGGIGTVTMLQSVDADLDLLTGTTRDVFFVPEPAVALQLGCSALTLAALKRLRRRSSRGTERA